MDTTPAAAAVPAESHPALFDEIGSLINQSGGVSGMAQQFQQKGLGGLFSSWVSSGPNPPISGDQIIQAIGQQRVTEMAGRLGLSEPQVAMGISYLLPKLINEITPQGTVPQHNPGELDSVLGMLKNRFFGSQTSQT